MPSESNCSSGKNALRSREVKTNAGVSFFRAFHSTPALFSYSGESLFTLFASLTHAYHYLMKVIK